MENRTQSLCRICLNIGHFHLSGYEINIQGKNISIDEMIKRFSIIEFPDENAPELICENCTHDLVQSYLFTEKILEADAKILSLTQLAKEEKLIYEEELQSEKDDEEEVVSQSFDDQEDVASQNIELHNMENQDIGGESMEGLSAEYQDVIEEEHGDLIEENTEIDIVDEVYIDSEISADEQDEILYPEEQETTVSPVQLFIPENLANIYHNNNLFEPAEEKSIQPRRKSIEPRRKYQRRNKTQNEIDENCSFVITQFSCSTTAPGMNRIANAEDTDEVTLSDVRIMNYETVEVKAGNIDVLNQAPQNELPIDDSRVYLCQYCPRAFSSSAFLVAHVRKTHGCKFCASLFEKAKDLYTHIREAHSKFECVVCGKQFASNSNMRNHIKIVHKLKVPANVSLIAYKKQSDIEETS